MARKNTATKSTAPVVARNFDIPSLEKRVYNMDSAKMRNYDIFSLEKRIHNLEQNGASPTPTPETPTIVFMRLSNGALTGEYKATKDTKFMLVSSSNNWSTYNFAINSIDISSELTSKAIQSSSAYAITYFNMKKDDTITWTITNGARSFVAFDTNDYEGE